MIPNKSNFKFQELTPITGVKPYVIRFWETEFEDISPVTSDSGQRLYARKDVEAILKIKKLLFEEKLTIQEAKIAIKSRVISFESQGNDLEASEHLSMKSSEKNLAKESVLTFLQLISEIKSKKNW
jgi:DNA-binding transcriptional MerR regulator